MVMHVCDILIFVNFWNGFSNCCVPVRSEQIMHHNLEILWVFPFDWEVFLQFFATNIFVPGQQQIENALEAEIF